MLTSSLRLLVCVAVVVFAAVNDEENRIEAHDVQSLLSDPANPKDGHTRDPFCHVHEPGGVWRFCIFPAVLIGVREKQPCNE